MSATVTAEFPPQYEGQRKKVRATVTFDSAYVTGGEILTAAMFGLSELLDLVPEGVSTNGYSCRFDKSTKGLLAFRTDQVDDPKEQVPNGTDLSAESVRVTAIGY